MGDLEAVLERIAAHPDGGPLRGSTGRYRFEVDEGESVTLAVEDGRLSIGEGDGRADCTIGGSAADLVAIARGDRDLLTSAMQGLVRIDGDLPLAQRLVALFRTWRPDE